MTTNWRLLMNHHLADIRQPGDESSLHTDGPSSGEFCVTELHQNSGDRNLHCDQEGKLNKRLADETIYGRDNHEISDHYFFQVVTDFRNGLPCNFIFAHLNTNSFKHTFTCVSDILPKKLMNYLAISETKRDSSFPKSQFGIRHYVLYRQDLTSSSGGLIVYVRDDLPHRRLLNSEIKEDGFESLCIEITVSKSRTVISCVYKYPKMYHEFFLKCMSRITDLV